jgi:hypothetical protein
MRAIMPPGKIGKNEIIKGRRNMKDEILSIVDDEKKSEDTHQEEDFSTNKFWVLAAIVVNISIYSITYFKPSWVMRSDGEERDYIYYLLIGVGFYICHGAIEFYKQSRGESLKADKAVIDTGFLGTYRYESVLEQKKFIYSFSSVVGVFNAFVYLIFVSFFMK